MLEKHWFKMPEVYFIQLNTSDVDFLRQSESASSIEQQHHHHRLIMPLPLLAWLSPPATLGSQLAGLRLACDSQHHILNST